MRLEGKNVMKLFQKGVLGLITASMVLSMAACDEEGAPAATGDATLPATTTTAGTTVTTVDDELENPVDVSNLTIDFDTIKLENPRLTYLGIYDMTKAGDVKPAVKFYEATYASDLELAEGEKVITYENTSFFALQDTLAAKIQADMSPDLVDKQDNTYPHWMSKNLYEDLTPYMDLSQPQWDGLDEYIERYAWDGKHFYYPWTYNASPDYLIYNRGLFEELGINDPKEMYDAGEWTWDTFKNCMVQFVDKQGDDAVGYYGQNATVNFIASTGTQLIDIGSDGKLVNNFRDANVERATNFLEELRHEGLGSFYLDEIDVSEVPLSTGKAAFQAMGEWIFTNYCRNYKEMDFFFVPFPRDPQADEYYTRGSAFGYLVPKGSKNVEGACCFINCCRLTLTDPELAATTKESLMKNKKYSDEEYDFMQSFKTVQNFHPILDETLCFSTDVNNIVKKMLNDIAFDQSAEQTSWTLMREENLGVIQDAIDGYNALIK